MERGKIVWRDRRWKRTIVLGFLVIFIGILMFSISNTKLSNSSDDFYALLLIIILFVILIINIFTKSSYVRRDGIYIGNIGSDMKSLYIKSKFFKWEEIEYTKIAGKMTFIYRSSLPLPYLFLKPKKEHRIYNCKISNPQEFIQTLKKLNKFYLLDKKSREKYGN